MLYPLLRAVLLRHGLRDGRAATVFGLDLVALRFGGAYRARREWRQPPRPLRVGVASLRKRPVVVARRGRLVLVLPGLHEDPEVAAGPQLRLRLCAGLHSRPLRDQYSNLLVQRWQPRLAMGHDPTGAPRVFPQPGESELRQPDPAATATHRARLAESEVGGYERRNAGAETCQQVRLLRHVRQVDRQLGCRYSHRVAHQCHLFHLAAPCAALPLQLRHQQGEKVAGGHGRHCREVRPPGDLRLHERFAREVQQNTGRQAL
mmetsp:Transcript_110603/g.277032  ORF Transcript_110603/g.277032 Transcript_110603/m.277032 type:complete len:261 (-) Transcript_110603:661-1443(-)